MRSKILLIFLISILLFPQNVMAIISSNDLGINHAENNYELASNSGFGMQRLNVIWKNLQKDPMGDFDLYTKLHIHQQINNASKNGIQTILLIEEPPESVCNDFCPAIQNLDYYEDFLSKLIEEYGNNIKGIEIYNEPDREIYWPPKPNPKNYVDILRRTKEVRDRLSPYLKIILGGNSGPPDKNNGYTFLYDIYENGAKGLFDVFNYHHYTQNNAPDEEWSNPYYWYEIFDTFFNENDPKMKIWVTEIGYATDGKPTNEIVDESIQSDNLIKMYSLLFSLPRIEKVFLFELSDSNENSLKYGILYNNLKPKTGFYGTTNFINLIKNKSFVSRDMTNNHLQHFIYENDSEKLQILWFRKSYKYPKPGMTSWRNSSTFVSSSVKQSITIYNSFGEIVNPNINGNTLKVEVTSKPIIILEKTIPEDKKITNFLYENKIVSGFSDGSFHSERQLTRAELLKITFNALGIEIDNNNDSQNASFPDINKDDWVYSYAVKAKSLGIVKGDTDGSFYPNRNVSKYEAIKILTAAYGIIETSINISYKDVLTNSPFIDYIKTAKELNILPDTDYLNGSRYLYRGEMAEMVYKLLNQ